MDEICFNCTALTGSTGRVLCDDCHCRDEVVEYILFERKVTCRKVPVENLGEYIEE